jgi:hypothetical protein
MTAQPFAESQILLDGLRSEERTFSGPRTLSTLLSAVLNAVSPPIMLVQSLNIVTQTKGYESLCQPTTGISSPSTRLALLGRSEDDSRRGSTDSSSSRAAWTDLTLMLTCAISQFMAGIRSTPAILETMASVAGWCQALYVKGAHLRRTRELNRPVVVIGRKVYLTRQRSL